MTRIVGCIYRGVGLYYNQIITSILATRTPSDTNTVDCAQLVNIRDVHGRAGSTQLPPPTSDEGRPPMTTDEECPPRADVNVVPTGEKSTIHHQLHGVACARLHSHHYNKPHPSFRY